MGEDIVGDGVGDVGVGVVGDGSDSRNSVVGVWSTSVSVLVRVSLEFMSATTTRVSLEMATSAVATGAFGAGVVRLGVGGYV